MSITSTDLTYPELTNEIHFAKKRLEKTEDPAEKIRLLEHIKLMRKTQAEIKRRNLYEEMQNLKGGKKDGIY